MHFRGGRAAIDAKAYPDLEEFYDDLARVFREEVAAFGQAGCRYLQVDEVNFTYLCDPQLREEAKRNLKEDIDKLPLTYAKLINASIASRPEGMAVTMHQCRGNAYSTWMAEGGYDPVAEIVFNEIDVDGFFLEYDTPRAGDFSPLRFVPKGKIAILGLVTHKTWSVGDQGRTEEADQRSRAIPSARSTWASARNADLPAAPPATSFRSTSSGKSWSSVVNVAQEVWG